MLAERNLRLAFISLPAIVMLSLCCGNGEQSESNRAPELRIGETSAAAPIDLVGRWQAKRGNEFPAGEMEFFEGNRYRLREYLDDENQTTREGEYKLGAVTKPYAIDLCLGACDEAISGFVTLLGIVQFAAEDSVVIRFSGSDQRPASFPARPDENTLVLTRLQ
jgi:hypothetical protein